MRKVVPIVALVATLVFAAVALADNTYTVTSTVSPAKAGTKKKPVPVSLGFNYTVGSSTGGRPSLIDQYTIGFGGIRSNGKYFPACPASKINNASPSSDASCPSGSLVGTGTVNNVAGATANPNDTSQKCLLALKVYNGGAGKAALYLKGGPPTCPIAVSQAIDASYVSGPDGGTALQFSVQGALLHPLPGFDNSVVSVQSTIKKLTVKKKGKTYGYYEASGGCNAGKRTVQVLFHTVAGQSSTVKTTAKCAK